MTAEIVQKPTAPTRAAANTATAPATGRVNGVYDLPNPGRIAGWAIDRANEAAAVEVEIYREGKLLKRLRADRHRPDLERGGIGTGRYGFSLDLDPPVAPGMAFTLSVRAVTSDGVAGALRPTGQAAPNDDPVQTLLARSYDQTAALRDDLRTLKRAVEAIGAGADQRDTRAMLERIELVQARLDGAAATARPVADPAIGRGLRLAVGVALGLSLVAVILGLWSVFA